MNANARLPIGLFDSGVGGLTVFKAIRDLLPEESLIYLGDTARVPYGTKSRDTIARYTRMAADRLAACGIKMLVMACNTATSAALPLLRQALAPMPVLGVIEPGASAAIKASSNGVIAVIGTEATIGGKAYQEAIGRLSPKAQVIALPCTLFVSLAEEGWTDGPVAEAVAHRYLDGIFAGADKNRPVPDTLLLGCTHFPLLLKALQKVAGPHVRIVDSARATARSVKESLGRLGLLQGEKHGAAHRFLTTDNRERFSRAGSLFLGERLEPGEIELVDL